jgi:hypothetical protein
MQIIVEELDSAYYADIVLTPNELNKLHQSETIDASITFKHRKCYVGVRLQGFWDYEEDKRTKKDLQSDEGIQEGFPKKRLKGRPKSD